MFSSGNRIVHQLYRRCRCGRFRLASTQGAGKLAASELMGRHLMDAHVAALTALGMAVSIALSAHPPALALPEVSAFLTQLDISAHNEAALYFTPAGQGMISVDEA